MPETKPTVRQRRLGLELKKLRRDRGWTLEEAAARLEYSVSSLSKIENGRQRISARVLPFVFQVFEVVDEGRQAEIKQLVRDMTKRDWWQEFKGVISDPFADYLSLESTASELSIFNPLVIPGLLQTDRYAEAVAQGSRAWRTQEEVQQFVRVRLARQEVLTREPPLRLWVVLTEAVLHQEVGDAEARREQLVRLSELTGELPHVNIQILPYSAGAHAGMDGPFSLLSFPTGGDVVCLESMRASLYLEQDEEVGPYAAALDHLKSSALSTQQSRIFVDDMIKELS